MARPGRRIKREKKEVQKVSMTDMGIYAMALGILYLIRKVHSYKVLSPLALMLDRESFENFIDHFGGMHIKVPTREDVNVAIEAVVAYQMRIPGDNAKSLMKRMHEAGFTDMTLEEASLVLKESSKIGNALGSFNADLFLEKQRRRKKWK